MAAVEQGWGRPATGETLDQAVVAQDELYDERQAEIMDEYDAKDHPARVSAGDRLEQMFAAVGRPTSERCISRSLSSLRSGGVAEVCADRQRDRA